MENKNIILEVDESTGLMVEKIKSSILSGFLEKVSSLQSNLSGLLEANKTIIEDINRKAASKKDLERVAEDVSDMISDELSDLNDKLKNIPEIPDLKPLASKVDNLQDYTYSIFASFKKELSEEISQANASQRKANDSIIKASADHHKDTLESFESLRSLNQHNQAALISQSEILLNSLNQSFKSMDESIKGLDKTIKEESQKRETFEQSIKKDVSELNEKINLLINKFDEYQTAYDSNHSSIMERLIQILHTVTPFWKRNKINE